MLKRAFLALVLATGFCAGQALCPAAASDFNAVARQFVDKIGAEAIQTFGTPDKDARYARFRELLNRSFDVPAIARFVLGAYWNRTTPEQQAQFLKVFEDYVVANYAAKPWDVKGVYIEVVSTIPNNENDIAVDTLIHVPHKQNKPIGLGWRIFNAAPAPKIIDLKVDGLSLVVSQRAEFTSVLQQKNNNFPAFIEFVVARTRQLENTPQPQKSASN
ncbi:MAG: ABC transporter substrate-binding protein [Alphaproteobacteria bacterium]|nr:ABC transporter substrate-binding protein [Alphaproteobacteria bacterium]